MCLAHLWVKGARKGTNLEGVEGCKKFDHDSAKFTISPLLSPSWSCGEVARSQLAIKLNLRPLEPSNAPLQRPLQLIPSNESLMIGRRAIKLP